MAMIGPPAAWLSASPAAFDDGCAKEALAKSSPDAQMLPTTPANTLRFGACMRGPLKLPAGDITARFAEPLRSRLTVRICHMRWPSLRASRANASLSRLPRLTRRHNHRKAALEKPCSPGFNGSAITSPGPGLRDVNPLLR